MNHYILDETGNPKLATSIEEWAEWYNAEKLLVKKDVIAGIFIWTNFVSIPADPANPKFWRTKVIGGTLDQLTELCGGKRGQGEAQHAAILERVLGELNFSKHNTKPPPQPE